MFDIPFAIPHESLYADLGVGPEASTQEVIDGKIEKIGRLQARQRTLAGRMSGAGSDAAEESKREIAAIESQIARLNALSLYSADERQKYDQANPPFEILRLDGARELPWSAPESVLAAVREELTAYFTARGEPVFHPTDLTRMDFSNDFTPCPLLDGK